jgi:hypothetical protein
MKRFAVVALIGMGLAPFGCGDADGVSGGPNAFDGEGGSSAACVTDTENLYQAYRPQTTCCPTPEDPNGPAVECHGMCYAISDSIIDFSDGGVPHYNLNPCQCGPRRYDGSRWISPPPCSADQECCGRSGPFGEDRCVPKGHCVDCRPERSAASIETSCCYGPNADTAVGQPCRGVCTKDGQCTCGKTEGGCGPGRECCSSQYWVDAGYEQRCVDWGKCPNPEPGAGADCSGTRAREGVMLSCCNGEACRGVCLDEDNGTTACYCKGPGSCPEGTECCDWGSCGPSCVPAGECRYCETTVP